MGLPSEHVPIPLKGASPADLQKKIAKFQATQGGKCQIFSIYFDGSNHIAWVYPLENLGMNVTGI